MGNRFKFNFTAINKIVPVDIDSWNTYNSKGQISQYDATFKWWQWTVNHIIGEAMPILNATTPAIAIQKLTAGLAQSICTTSQTYCKGFNQQYSSASECFDYLTKKVRFGEAYELGMSTDNGFLEQKSQREYADSFILRPQYAPLPISTSEHGSLAA